MTGWCLTAKQDRILDDLRSQLEDSDADTWHDAIAEALNEAWDALLKAEPSRDAP